MSDGFNTLLAKGVAELLATAVPSLTWRADGSVYQAGETAVVIGKMPASPDRCVALTPYPLSDDPALSDSTVGLQVRCRGERGSTVDASDLDDLIADQILGLYPVDLTGGIRVTTLMRRSGVPLGVDDENRPEQTSNYELGVWRPSVHRT